MRSATVGLTVGAHLAYLAYLPSGGFLALRWPRSIALHIPVVLWGIGVVVFELPCPLTELEQRLRMRAGMDLLPESGFIDRYVDGKFYPEQRTGAAQALAFCAAGVSWIMLARKRQRRGHAR
ncbi:DUF2784 domain-containing protein [Mycobacterium cookii]|uniref:DUF2784 domain-containing protein n=1 Tax=Mycobacterium cookii TaxID=1775 RepID=A0A7I7L4Y8_9MYCO|nr:DUF2784 domain-containing protein [Mycobacterium cookii]MCV7329296.1 DUF2784 domain-containing protein [Mycobacterium cookii]BBX48871.1 hypothetical protein MCOO_48860 [Mycobacterium cookii]